MNDTPDLAAPGATGRNPADPAGPVHHDSITSDRVEGTNIFAADGEKMGHVKMLVIEKVGGKVTDIVVAIGGFLGLGAALHRIPWEKFDYDVGLGGYRLGLTEEELKSAPTFVDEEQSMLLDPIYRDRVYQYYAVTPYWY